METTHFKKILASVIVVLLPLNLFAYDVKIDGIYYNLIPRVQQATVTNNGNVWLSGPYIGNIIIPEKITYEGVEYSVTAIDGEAFQNCKSLTSILIPNSITTIGGFAFWGCSSLTSIQIPNSVTKIGSVAFGRCSSLTSIQIPNSVTEIEESTFSGCSSLSFVQIPNSVSKIGGAAFASCSSLTFIQIPNSVTSIDAQTFNNCSSLTSIQIPNSVTVIDHDAFNACKNLTSVILGNSIKYIYQSAFCNCINLENVYCNAEELPNISADAFAGSYIEYANLYVPAESIDTYKSADVWKDFGSIHSLNDVTFAEAINVGASKAVLRRGESETLTPNVLPTNATNKSVTWSSSNSDIVSVNAETGKVTAVSYGSALISATAKDGSNVKGSITIIVKAENYTIPDGEDYQNDQEFPCDELTYTRNFSNTNWQALYVPFGMEYDDWAEDFVIARLNDVHQFDDDDDGVIDRTALESIKLKPGSCVEPNTPYMIKAKTAGEKTITLTDATLYATEENSHDVTSWYTRFIFTGTYHTVTDMATQGHYALSSGGLKLATSDAVQLKPFRWYVDITDRNGAPIPSMAKIINIVFDDGEATSLESINAETVQSGDIYTVSGVKVTDMYTLPKGVYIKNGKKILVK